MSKASDFANTYKTAAEMINNPPKYECGPLELVLRTDGNLDIELSDVSSESDDKVVHGKEEFATADIPGLIEWLREHYEDRPSYHIVKQEAL